MGKYLPDSAQTWGGYAGAALGTALILWGIADAKDPDYNVDPTTMRAIHEAARDWQGYTLTEDLGGRLQGLALAGVGLVIAGASVAVASAEPSRVVAEAGRDKGGNAQPIRLPADPKETQHVLIERLQPLLSNEPILQEILGANLVIITGAMGSGKSSAATAIAALRQLLLAHDVLVLDPDLDQNLEDERWVCGDLWGSAEHHGEFRAVWERIKRRVYAVRTKAEGEQTVILDEFTKYPNECQLATEDVGQMAGYLAQGIRKMQQRPLVILHATEGHLIESGNLWGMGKGDYESILTQAAILQLEVKPAGIKGSVASGRAHYKPPGKPNLVKNYNGWSVPNLMRPGQMHKELAQLMHQIGIKPNFHDGRLITPEIQDLIGRRMNPNDPEFINRLNAMVNEKTAASVDPSENVRSLDWDALPDRDRSIKFVKYLLEKGQSQVSEDGDFEVTKLAKNWGRHNDFDNPEFRNFLDTLEYFGVGRFTDVERSRWALTVDPGNLPDETA